MKVKRILIPGVCASLLLLTACFQGEQSVEIDPPENAEAVNDTAEEETTEAQGTENVEENEEIVEEEMVGRELYLIDANGFVASQMIELPLEESFEVAGQVLEYLVEDGPITEVLPNGFRAVLPAGTEVLGLNLEEDGTMIVDFSEEFNEYREEDEVKILESITHTLTQFDSVERIKLRVNGQPLNEMPVNGTPIERGYSKAHGINVTESDTIDLINSEAVTMYYPAGNEESRYYIPVTQYVETIEEGNTASIVNSLLDGPAFLPVVQVFNSHTMLTSEPIINDGVVELEFNEAILLDEEGSIVADDVMETIVRTLTAQEDIEAVDVKVENVESISNENGKVYSEPVSRNAFVPTEEF